MQSSYKKIYCVAFAVGYLIFFAKRNENENFLHRRFYANQPDLDY